MANRHSHKLTLGEGKYNPRLVRQQSGSGPRGRHATVCLLVPVCQPQRYVEWSNLIVIVFALKANVWESLHYTIASVPKGMDGCICTTNKPTIRRRNGDTCQASGDHFYPLLTTIDHLWPVLMYLMIWSLNSSASLCLQIATQVYSDRCEWRELNYQKNINISKLLKI